MLLVEFIRQKKWIALTVGILLVSLIVLSLTAVVILKSNAIYDGVFIDDVDVSGLSINDARMAVLSRLNEKYGDETVTLKYGGEKWNFRLSDISYKFRIKEAIEKAFLVGRSGDILDRLSTIIKTRNNKVYIKLETEFDKSKLTGILEKIKKQIDSEGKNASITFDKGKINIEKDVAGKFLDIDINIKLIENNILNKKFGNMELYVKDVNPEIMYEDIKEIDSVLASFSTKFNKGQVNRSYNISLACERLNGTIIPVGGVFSMDKTLGPRTVENGFKEAPVIYKNEFVPGAGGGVCQVSTTLYVAVLKSKLEIVERKNHSLPLGYVDPGQDATIAEGSIDFKFRNSKDYPICIYAGVEGNKLEIKIYGRKEGEEYTVKLVSEIVEVYYPEEDEVIIDDSVPDMEKVVLREAKNGMRVIVYRDTYTKDGELLSREKVSEDVYWPVRGQVKVNSKYYEIMQNPYLYDLYDNNFNYEFSDVDYVNEVNNLNDLYGLYE